MADCQGMTFKAGPPLQPISSPHSWQEARLETSFPMFNFALRPGWTLETFPSRSERSGSTVGNGHAGKEVRRHFSDVLAAARENMRPTWFLLRKSRNLLCAASPTIFFCILRPALPYPYSARKSLSRLDPYANRRSRRFFIYTECLVEMPDGPMTIL